MTSAITVPPKEGGYVFNSVAVCQSARLRPRANCLDFVGDKDPKCLKDSLTFNTGIGIPTNTQQKHSPRRYKFWVFVTVINIVINKLIIMFTFGMYVNSN